MLGIGRPDRLLSDLPAKWNDGNAERKVAFAVPANRRAVAVYVKPFLDP